MEKKQALKWLSIWILALIFGAVWGVAPRLLAGIMIGSVPSIGPTGFKLLLVMYLIPSILIWTVATLFLRGDRRVACIVLGVCSPFVGFLVFQSMFTMSSLLGWEINRSSLGLDDPSLAVGIAFTNITLAIPVGTTAGLLMHRVINKAESRREKALS